MEPAFKRYPLEAATEILPFPRPVREPSRERSLLPALKRVLAGIDKELIIVFLLVSITAIIYYFVMEQRAFLNFFYIPVALSAYFFGKRHGTYSAFLSVLLMFLMGYFIPGSFINGARSAVYKWLDFTIWAGFLVLTAYLIGHLYEKKEAMTRELRGTYKGILTMLSIIIDSVDKQTQNHSYRVARYAEQMARGAGLPEKDVEEIRVASLLHDLGKIGISADILSKLGKLSEEERGEIRKHARRGAEVLESIGGGVLNVVPLILNHHERYDGEGYYGLKGEEIPLGAQIIAVADVYDALTTDRPYRKAYSPLEAKKEIINGSGSQFNPQVVRCFERVFPTLHDLTTHELDGKVL